MKIKHYFLFAFVFLMQAVMGQTQQITGTILDAVNVPLPGANVLVKGTNTGTLTDFDGNFSIAASQGDVLVISYVGYNTQEIPVNADSNFKINLTEDTNSLDEVVVVGYGTQKKSVVTGAISSVKAEDLESLPVTRVEQSLQGRSSGLTIAANSGQPGSSSTIRVRGITSFGNNEPLWVVDGVIVDAGGIGYLNQSDIASIEVLKDAASQAIYGARAAAGVILVTTKKGKSGKLSVNYNGYSGLSGPARKLDLLNGTQYATLYNEKYANDYSGPVSGYALPFADPQSFGKGIDWQDAIFNNAAERANHEVSLSGGNDVSTFYLSFGYLDQEGIVTKDISHYTRKNIRLNSTHKINDIITIGQTIGYSNEKSTGLGNTNSEFGGPLSSAINLDPLTPVVETDPALVNGSPYSSNDGILRSANGNPYGISNLVIQEMTNPLAYTQTRLGNYNWADNFVGNVYVNLELIPGLNLKSTLGGKLANYGAENFTPVSYLNSSVVTSQNSFSQEMNRGFGWNIENTLNYTKEINGHNFSVLLGQGTYTENDTRGSTVTYNNIPVTNREDAAFFEVPDDQIISSAYIGTEHRVTSLFTRLTYDFKEKYLFTGIIRRDGSTRFGSNNKYGYFPSFSLGWVPTKEDFWPENDVVSQLKIRGGYGVVGSDAIGDFRYLSTIGAGRNYTFGNVATVVIGNSPNAPANPDLKWEETHQTNIGFDTRLFNNLTLTFDYYNKKTVGILQDLRIPGYVGTGNPAANVADMVNRGFDIELGYNKTFGDFNISANANLSYLENEVTYLGDGIDFLSGGQTIQSGNYPITRTAVGESFNSFYGFKTNGIFQNQAEVNNYVNSAGQVIQPNAVPGDFKWVDLDDDGAITEADRKFLGNSIPKYTFGFTLNMDYKNFDLLIFTQGAAGNKIFQGLRRLDIENANYQTEALGRWTGEGTSNSYPRLLNSDANNNFSNPSDFYLEKGDYVRIKTVQLGYSLPTDVIDKVGLSRLRLYVTGENLFTFTKYTGFDPEIGGGVFGIDRGFYPQAVTGLVGVNLQF
ncbi:SusC/RagA family TonB-linked outer membrane protein [Flavimarina sp. Hel_I_48]|uniref:SusC/RagA family TonB-linked outer membrane protein n=1 Tax=Flavimarina sp. Hel_I_48 TaxID=1392488 RepID=UPI0004DEF7F2|nr:TonB-dependent receptor [Flavimarina sp. Hel_I_48]